MGVLTALTALAACAAAGHLQARSLAVREQRLRAWAEAWERAEGALRRGGEELPALLRLAAGQDVPALAGLARQLEENPGLAPGDLLLPQEPLLSPAETEALLACLPALFSPDPGRQLAAVERTREAAERLCRAALEKKEKNGRLSVSLGWLAGAAAFLLLC